MWGFFCLVKNKNKMKSPIIFHTIIVSCPACEHFRRVFTAFSRTKSSKSALILQRQRTKSPNLKERTVSRFGNYFVSLKKNLFMIIDESTVVIVEINYTIKYFWPSSHLPPKNRPCHFGKKTQGPLAAYT